MRAPAAGVAAASLATLALAGCGGAPPESLIDLRAQAATVCRPAQRALARIPTPRGEAQGEAFLSRGVAVLARELRSLRALRAPSDASDVYATATDAVADELNAMRGAIAQLDSGVGAIDAFRSLQQQLAALESQADGAWQALEVSACLTR